MTPLRATALARKWCAYCKGDRERMNPNAPHYHGAIEAALYEVVERCVEIAEQAYEQEVADRIRREFGE